MIDIIPNWHPVFVHFTVALVSLSCLFFILLKVVGLKIFKGELFIITNWFLWLGALFSVVTVIAGFDAYNTVAHDAPSHAAMTIHKNWALTTFGVLLILTAWSLFKYKKAEKISSSFCLGVIILLFLLLSTAWRGGELVYRYGLGVMSLPEKSEGHGDGHKHDHGVNLTNSAKKKAPVATNTPETLKNTEDNHRNDSAVSPIISEKETTITESDNEPHDHKSHNNDKGIVNNSEESSNMRVDTNIKENTGENSQNNSVNNSIIQKEESTTIEPENKAHGHHSHDHEH